MKRATRQEPGNETAATVPLQGSDAAVFSGQPKQRGLDGQEQVHLTRERKTSQSSRAAQAGRPIQQNRIDPLWRTPTFSAWLLCRVS